MRSAAAPGVSLLLPPRPVPALALVWTAASGPLSDEWAAVTFGLGFLHSSYGEGGVLSPLPVLFLFLSVGNLPADVHDEDPGANPRGLGLGGELFRPTCAITWGRGLLGP
jgi:hypothetical protein